MSNNGVLKLIACFSVFIGYFLNFNFNLKLPTQTFFLNLYIAIKCSVLNLSPKPFKICVEIFFYITSWERKIVRMMNDMSRSDLFDSNQTFENKLFKNNDHSNIKKKKW